ncbi:MAG: DoxX family protein [Ktedonobacterales bacterium]
MPVANVALWIVQGALALVYLMAGGIKVFQPIALLSKSMTWVSATPPVFVRLIGIAELLGAIGLILPMLTGIVPGLVVVAAIGLALVQISAAIFHLARHEGGNIAMNLVLLLLALFVAIGRLLIVKA